MGTMPRGNYVTIPLSFGVEERMVETLYFSMTMNRRVS
jgi:hypothetical protein